MPDLDARLTFETFVVGAANRLAASAAWRVAEKPGGAYNPLLLYGASGLGKTHLLMAIGQRAAQLQPHITIVYDALARAADPARDGLDERWRNAHLLLLDDAQFLAERTVVQEQLLDAWDAIVRAAGQIVFASDRPPNEIAGLDGRLLSRMSAGLVADLAPPEHDTRVQIANRLAAASGQTLAEGVADQIARSAFGSVRELQGGVQRVLATQELEERRIRASEVRGVLGLQPAKRGNEFGTFLSEVSGALGEALERLSPEQRLAEAILRWEGEGYRTTRLEAALAREPDAEEAERVAAGFESDVGRLRALEQQIRDLDATAPELKRADVLRDPDMLSAAEALVGRVRARLATSGGASAAAVAPGGNGAGSHAAAATAAQRTGARMPPAWDAVIAAAQYPGDGWSEQPAGDVVDGWFLSREKVLWRWPYIEDVIVSELD